MTLSRAIDHPKERAADIIGHGIKLEVMGTYAGKTVSLHYGLLNANPCIH